MHRLPSASVTEAKPHMCRGRIPRVELTPGSLPLLDQEFADPGVLRVGEVYYAYGTNSGNVHIQVARSRDLIHWELLPDALPVLPSWASHEAGWTCAPAVTATPEGYAMYFVSRCGRVPRPVQAIGVAMSNRPQGPFEPMSSAPLICQRDQGGAIDPSMFVDDDGARYLIWKNDSNVLCKPTWIYLQAMSLDGLTLKGRPTPLFANDQPWEGQKVQAPTLVKRENRYFLFYSANHHGDARHAIGYAVADHIRGPYRKLRMPFLTTNRARGIIGPGGQDILAGSDGSTLMFFHSLSPTGYRALNVARLHWR